MAVGLLEVLATLVSSERQFSMTGTITCIISDHYSNLKPHIAEQLCWLKTAAVYDWRNFELISLSRHSENIVSVLKIWCLPVSRPEHMAARIILRKWKFDRITADLGFGINSTCLPVQQSIEYKVCVDLQVLTSCSMSAAWAYLSTCWDVHTGVCVCQSKSSLFFSAYDDLVAPHCRTTICTKTFCCFRSDPVELTAADCMWPITDTDSVLCTS